jgi:ABC-2 type transport system ATP-binding protein
VNSDRSDRSERSEGSDRSPVVLEHVTVSYGSHQALRDVSVAFPEGAVGLLGPNGAGKSTLIKALLGLLRPAGGVLRVLDHDVAEAPLPVRAGVGYMPEHDTHIPGMNAVSFVAYCGELCGLPHADAMQRAHEVLFYVGLGEARYRNVETYSTGMKQRIKLAQALVHDPDLLLLDEPTNGMDPKGRDEMLALIRDVANPDRERPPGRPPISVILSSHVLPDVEFACNHVVVLHRGVVATHGPIAALKGDSARVFELRINGDEHRFVEALREVGIQAHDELGDVMRVLVPADRPAQVLFQVAARQGVQVRHFRPSVPSLEDVFARALGD